MGSKYVNDNGPAVSATSKWASHFIKPSIRENSFVLNNV